MHTCSCWLWNLTICYFIQNFQTEGEEAWGLSSQEALKRLFDAINDELAIYKEANPCTWWQDLWNTLNQNHHLPMGFISLSFLILEFLVLVLSYALAGSERRYVCCLLKKGPYFMRVTCDSELELLINLWPLVHTFYPLPHQCSVLRVSKATAIWIRGKSKQTPIE